ncbi:hypothetical protein DKP79_28395, partial [Klebsiella pneumoniae]|uniref:hypothetical protein n=1 Tax=Klebsiella pneumoniae TaxID=573 RepID=UPI000D8B9C3C
MEENYNEEEPRKQWDQFQAFQSQQEKQKYVKSKSKKPWISVGVGNFIFLTMIIVMLGVEKGFEKASKIMMPL